MEDSRPLEKILIHYIDIINSVLFDSDIKLADICLEDQMVFVPLGYLFERILAVPASSAPVEPVFSPSRLLVRPHPAKMSDKLLESLVFAKCSIFSWLLWSWTVCVANFVITVIFWVFGIRLCQLSLITITYPFIYKLIKMLLRQEIVRKHRNTHKTWTLKRCKKTAETFDLDISSLWP